MNGTNPLARLNASDGRRSSGADEASTSSRVEPKSRCRIQHRHTQAQAQVQTCTGASVLRRLQRAAAVVDRDATDDEDGQAARRRLRFQAEDALAPGPGNRTDPVLDLMDRRLPLLRSHDSGRAGCPACRDLGGGARVGPKGCCRPLFLVAGATCMRGLDLGTAHLAFSAPVFVASRLSVSRWQDRAPPFCGPVEKHRDSRGPRDRARLCCRRQPTGNGDSPANDADPNARCKVQQRKNPHDQLATTRIALPAAPNNTHKRHLPLLGAFWHSAQQRGAEKGGALARTRVEPVSPSSKLGARGSTPATLHPA